MTSDSRDLHNKVVVITGASSGFGRGVALHLASAGASLILAARRTELLTALAQECEALGGRALAAPTDVSRPDEVTALMRKTLVEHHKLDVWINDAGVGAIGRFEDVPLADHAQVIATNLLGVLYGSWHAYRQFTAQRSGTLINIASELGRYGVPYYASYTASKHGVLGLSESLRQEARMAGLDDVHVCTVLPTAHDTPFFDHAAHYSGRAVQAASPLRDPQDVVETIVRLVRNPQDRSVMVGEGAINMMMRKLAPGVQDAMSARYMHRLQMENAPPASDSSGAVHYPMDAGVGVSAGRRELQ